jgi:tRNA(adenine34) deaminase
MDEEFFMKRALEEAKLAFDKGEVPVGVVIVKDGEIIARAHNLKETLFDATAHAELLAIRQACEYLRNWRLVGCELYTTLEPCPMCAGAIVLARIKKLVYGASDPKTGACGSVINLFQNEQFNHHVEVVAGVLAEESLNLLQPFFKALRK